MKSATAIHPFSWNAQERGSTSESVSDRMSKGRCQTQSKCQRSDSQAPGHAAARIKLLRTKIKNEARVVLTTVHIRTGKVLG